MVSIAACHAVDRSSILLGTAKFCSVRLSVRTLAFHVSKEGFDSPTERHVNATVAERPKATDCKSVKPLV